jgi:hypothetical protein
VIALTLPFIRPFTLGAFPDSGDGLLNLYRVVGLDFAVRHGDLWPRFLTAMNYGFGAPNFNYYGLLSLYPPELFHLAFGLSLPDAYLAGIITYAAFAATGAYLLGKTWAGPVAGLTTAVAYVYAPPLFHTFDRPAQFLAVALFPWILWAFRSLATHHRRRDSALATLLFSALLLTHNVSALYIAPMIGLYVLFLAWLSDEPRRTLVRLILPLVFALGLSVFFWLPALAEADYVQLERLDIPMFDFHNNFLPLRDTFTLPTGALPGRFPGPRVKSIGWPQLALGLLGLGATFRPAQSGGDRAALRGLAGLCLLLFGASIFLTTGASLWIWENVPLVRLILFPERLLYAASLFLALLAGLGVAFLTRAIRPVAGQTLWLVICLGGTILFTLPSQHVGYLEEEPRTWKIVHLHRFERETGWLAATSAGEFVPRWVEKMPDAWTLTDRFRESEIIPRLQSNPAVNVQNATWGLKRAELTFSAETATTLVFEWFYFPGWTARLDGEPVAVGPTSPNGLLSLDVPAGEHHLLVRFGPTPVRRGATLASLATLLVFAAFIVLARRPWRGGTKPAPPEAVSLLMIVALAAIGVLIFAVTTLRGP